MALPARIGAALVLVAFGLTLAPVLATGAAWPALAALTPALSETGPALAAFLGGAALALLAVYLVAAGARGVRRGA